MTGSRRLSQAISEGDGISVIALVADDEAAAAAEASGAEGVAVASVAPGVRDATGLPLLHRGETPAEASAAGADAWVLVAERFDADELEELYEQAHELGLECVVDVHDEEELEAVLERLDPEIILLSPREPDDGEEPIDRILALLPDVPAGKLAIAELASTTRDEVTALERAGVDAVLVASGDVADLVGGSTPDV